MEKPPDSGGFDGLLLPDTLTQAEKIEQETGAPSEVALSEIPPWRMENPVTDRIYCKFVTGKVGFEWCKTNCRLFCKSVCHRLDLSQAPACPFDFFGDEASPDTCFKCELADRCAEWRWWRNQYL